MPRSTTTAPATIANRSGPNNAADDYHLKKQGVIFIGWVGIGISSMMVFASLVALYARNAVAETIIGEYFEMADSVEIGTIAKVVVVISSTLYALSLINILVSTMLIIGVSRRYSCLLFPWLVFYGLLLCAGLHLGIYLIISGFCIQIEYLVILILASICTIFLFLKIYGDVLDLYRKLQSDAKANRRMAAQLELIGEREGVMRQEDSRNSTVPYQSFI